VTDQDSSLLHCRFWRGSSVPLRLRKRSKVEVLHQGEVGQKFLETCPKDLGLVELEVTPLVKRNLPVVLQHLLPELLLVCFAAAVQAAGADGLADVVALAGLPPAEGCGLVDEWSLHVGADGDILLAGAELALAVALPAAARPPPVGHRQEGCPPVLQRSFALARLVANASAHGLEHGVRLADELVELEELEQQREAEREHGLESVVGDDLVVLEEGKQVRRVVQHVLDLATADGEVVAAEILPHA